MNQNSSMLIVATMNAFGEVQVGIYSRLVGKVVREAWLFSAATRYAPSIR